MNFCKNTLKTAWLGLVLYLFFPLSSLSQPSGSQLEILLADLAQSPTGSVEEQSLEETIIDLVLAMDSAPEPGSEYRRFMVRGEMAGEMATGEAGHKASADEYRAAARVAPWMAKALYNLAAEEEKAGNLDAAVSAYRLYLKAAPAAPDYASVEEKVFRLEYQAEIEAKKPLARQPEPEGQTSAPLDLPEVSREELLFYQRGEGVPEPRNMKSIASDFPTISSFVNSGKVLVSFDIEENGRTSNYRMLTATQSGDYDDEAKNVVKKMRFDKGQVRRGVIYDLSFCKRTDRLRKLICDIRFEKVSPGKPKAPKLVAFAVPKYNTNAVRKGICGAVNVRFDITAEGTVANSAIVASASAGGQFGFNVKEAVDAFKFAGGYPTTGVEYRVSFGLPGTCPTP